MPSRRQGAVNPRGYLMTLANKDSPRTPAPDDAQVDDQALAYTWYDPDSADFDRADRWAPVDSTEDDEAATLDHG